MSDGTWFLDDQYDGNEDEPKGLRDAYKALKADHKRLTADLAAATSRADEAEKAVKAKSFDQILADKKVPLKIARWIKRDEVEPTAEAVDKWLAENGEDFGWKPGGEQPAEQATETTETVTDEAKLNSLGREPAPNGDKESAVKSLASKFEGSTDLDAVIKALRDQGM